MNTSIINLSIDDIKPYHKNAKKHPKDQIEKIANSILEFGFNQPIVVDKDNVIIVGHGRFEAGKTLGLKEVPARAIINSSKQEDIVLDQFLGSGSTLIACEKTNRRCYGLELDPKFADTIVQRYVNYTGNTKIKKNGVEIEWAKTKDIRE